MNNKVSIFKSLKIFVFIISDTKTESTDKSGKILENRIKQSGHSLVGKIFIKDEPKLIKKGILKVIKEKKNSCSHFNRWHRINWSRLHTRGFKRNNYKRNSRIW